MDVAASMQLSLLANAGAERPAHEGCAAPGMPRCMRGRVVQSPLACVRVDYWVEWRGALVYLIVSGRGISALQICLSV